MNRRASISREFLSQNDEPEIEFTFDRFGTNGAQLEIENHILSQRITLGTDGPSLPELMKALNKAYQDFLLANDFEPQK